MDSFKQKVLQKRVELVYKLLPIGIVATIINSTMLSYFLWNIVNRVFVVSWLIIQIFFALLRLLIFFLFKADKNKTENIEKWRNLYAIVVIFAGVIWGSGSYFGILHNYFVYQVLVAVVIGGTCAGAATIYSALRRIYYGFVITALLPQIIIFFIVGSAVQVALGLMLLLFGIVISFSAETNRKIIISNFNMILKNEDMIKFLRESNEKARFEIVKRKQIESELMRSQTNLEQKVKERTVELSKANRGLKLQIDKRIKVEKELKESEEYYRSIVETAQEGIWIIDKNHKISYTNKRMTQMLGYSTDELLGKDICQFLDSSQRAFHLSDRRKRGIRQKKLCKSDGTMIPVIEAESSLIDNSGLNRIKLGMVTDITERQIWETKIVNLNHRLQESNRELSEFSHSVSHDLKSPLHTIQAFCKLIMEEYAGALNGNGIEYLAIISKSADRMNCIISDLLNLSKVSVAQMHKENVNLSNIVTEIIENLRNQEPDRIVKLKVRDNVLAMCDPGLIRIVLENLINNSWKFTRNKDCPEIKFDFFSRDDKTIFYVEDNGAGFDMKYKDKLFKPFQRLHAESEFKGTGIGLATVKRIIQKHDGNIWAESEKNRGATFYFTL